HLPGGAFLAAPIRVGELGHDIASLFQSFQRQRYVKLTPQRGFHADLNVVVVDKYRYVQFVLHQKISQWDIGPTPPARDLLLLLTYWHLFEPDILVNERDNRFKRSARLKHGAHANLFQLCGVLIWNNTAH